MCGLSGFIGNSKNEELTYEISTALFYKLEIRGDDASGFWAVNKEAELIYHKKASPSSILVNSPPWQSLKKFNPNLLLMHCRQASFGSPQNNENNHPFIGEEGKLGFIHNGRVPELLKSKKKYNMISDCDSEALLRIIEAYTSKMDGIKAVFTTIKWGHMAAALGDITSKNERELYLFRNRHRSLYTVDFLEELGQIFFCSTPDVWPEEYNNFKFNPISYNTVTHITLKDSVLYMESILAKDTLLNKFLRFIWQ
jgi:glucosamine 6-phosphate synthetase-like amidotransferase/phosphosugar isomerase protein